MARICGVCGYHLNILDRANYDKICPDFPVCDSCLYKIADLIYASNKRDNTGCIDAIKKLNIITAGKPSKELVAIYKKYFPAYFPEKPEEQIKPFVVSNNNIIAVKKNYADSIRTMASVFSILGLIGTLLYVNLAAQYGLNTTMAIIIFISLPVYSLVQYFLLNGFADIIDNTRALADKADVIAKYAAATAENTQVLSQLKQNKKQEKSNEEDGAGSADKD